MNKPYSFLLAACLLLSLPAAALDHPGLAERRPAPGRFSLVENGVPAAVVTDPADKRGVLIAAETLREDFARVCGVKAPAQGARVLYAGTKDSPLIKRLAAEGRIDTTPLNGQYETYILQVTGDTVIIAGADMRGTIYGIYEISEQMGVSPWYDWADVPVPHSTDISLTAGTYTVPQPGVRYRGIFLNDEAPCLTSWVKNTYGTDFGDHRFYARVFELLLRLRANFMWPAMWGWAFYADDPENSRTADEMGIVMGTSHHEPMARNHQEWARRRRSSGPWDYTTNKKVLTQFFTEGIERAKDTEDLITIGMRGDGDAALGKEGEEANYIKLLETIIKDQRKIIRKVTGKPAEQRPQVWALYKEVQQYYDLGLRAPDDVTILLSDDNWGDVRKLPTAAERARKGGWGLYYHVDYVGAPRNSKWLNVTPIQNMWEQLQLTWAYGVDRIWVLNVGDLKPMEYPIDLFLAMARNPEAITVDNLADHTRAFCAAAFGDDQADEAARILNLYCKYSGRTTAEMMDARTYDLPSGEFRQVRDDFVRLEAEALRQFLTLKPECKDAYRDVLRAGDEPGPGRPEGPGRERLGRRGRARLRPRRRSDAGIQQGHRRRQMGRHDDAEAHRLPDLERQLPGGPPAAGGARRGHRPGRLLLRGRSARLHGHRGGTLEPGLSGLRRGLDRDSGHGPHPERRRPDALHGAHGGRVPHLPRMHSRRRDKRQGPCRHQIDPRLQQHRPPLRSGPRRAEADAPLQRAPERGSPEHLLRRLPHRRPPRRGNGLRPPRRPRLAGPRPASPGPRHRL